MKKDHLPLIDDTTSEADAPAIVSASDESAAPSASPFRPRKRRLIGPDARLRQQRRIRYALLAVSAVFMVNALVGDNGVLATMKAKRLYEQTQRELNALREDNQRLKVEMQRLKSDPTAIEEEARKNLGLIRPGETLVIIKDAAHAK